MAAIKVSIRKVAAQGAIWRIVRHRAPRVSVPASGNETLLACFQIRTESSRVALAALLSELVIEPFAAEMALPHDILVGRWPSGAPFALPGRAGLQVAIDVSFQPDIAAEIATMFGGALDLVRLSPLDRIPSVATGRVDIVMGAMARIREQVRVTDHLVPLHTTGFGIERIGNLNKSSITPVQVRGTTAIPWIERNIPETRLRPLDDQDDRDRAPSVPGGRQL